MSVQDDDEREYQSTSRQLEALIGTHYRPSGRDAVATFASLQVWLRRLSLEDALGSLSVIHVAGTKGKGSTCAFAERILRSSGRRTGLFTSPHLLDIRERFRVNGRVFVEHFTFVHDRLQATATAELGLPPFFYFLTLLALRIFHHERVDVAVLEVGLGGRWDATNLVPSPAVCGISSLGYDHMEILGHTLTEIAGEKAGIFKPGVPAVSAPEQPAEAAAVLERQAEKLQIPFTVAPLLDSFEGVPTRLGLAGKHQRGNAALAVQLCRLWAQRSPLHRSAESEAQEEELSRGRLPAVYAEALAQTRWPGRAQVLPDAHGEECGEEPALNLVFHLDGAHTGESSAACAEWFAEVTPLESVRVLMFNCMKEREPHRLLSPIHSVLRAKGREADAAIFVPPEPASLLGKSSVGSAVDLSWQQTLRHTWDELDGRPVIKALPSTLAPRTSRLASAMMPTPTSALASLRRLAHAAKPARVHVLVTGSLYLVGNCLRLLSPPRS